MGDNIASSHEDVWKEGEHTGGMETIVLNAETTVLDIKFKL